MRQFILLVACLAIVGVSAKPGAGYSYNIPAGGGLAANLLPPTPIVNQQFAPSHGSLGLGHSSNGASLALGTSYSAASHSHHSFNGYGQGGLLSSLVKFFSCLDANLLLMPILSAYYTCKLIDSIY